MHSIHLLGASLDSGRGTWDAIVSAAMQVWDLASSRPVLLWLAVIAAVAALGSLIGSRLGRGLHGALGIVAGVIGIVIVWHILTSLGIL